MLVAATIIIISYITLLYNDTFLMKMGNFVVKEIGLCSEQLQFSKTKYREGQTKIDNKHVIIIL